nr:hypothetical protein [Tanacetum cinerariifolium]
KLNHLSGSKKPDSQSEQLIDDISILDDIHLSDSEDTNADHLPKIKTRLDWLKPIPEEETSETPKPDWIIPLNDLPKLENNWADAIAKSYQDPKENNKPLPLGGPPGQVTIQTQYFFSKDLEYLVSSDKERMSALSISKLKAAYYQDFRLEELVPSLWIESKCDYDISAAYSISYWWFKRKEFYITRHSAPSDRHAVRSHMKILSVVSLKTFSRYGYTYLKDIVLYRDDYQDYKILPFKFNLGTENRIWSEDDKRKSGEFIEVIVRRLKIRRICRNLESFVSGSIRDVDYRLI